MILRKWIQLLGYKSIFITTIKVKNQLHCFWEGIIILIDCMTKILIEYHSKTSIDSILSLIITGTVVAIMIMHIECSR